MSIAAKIKDQFGTQIALEEMQTGIFRLYTPFFHEDGDMFSMYIDTKSTTDILFRDFGNTMMRLSYTFDTNSSHKKSVIADIVKSNDGIFDDGELLLSTSYENLTQSIFRFSQIISKVSNVEILRRETVKTLFYENLNAYLLENAQDKSLSKNYTPMQDKQLVVDFLLPAPKPLFIFGVNENGKAAKVIINCLSFQKNKIPFRSLIVHENFESLSSFNRNQITNIADKQFTTLANFMSEGMNYIDRELVS